MKFGIWELLIIVLIVALLFGTKKLRTLGSDLGSAVKGFRSALSEAEKENQNEGQGDGAANPGRVIDGEVINKKDASQKV